jgi:hypothetical protein
MKLEDRQTYFHAAPIIRANRWARVTLTCNEQSDPIRYLPLDSSGERAAQTVVHHDHGQYTSHDPPWESAPVVSPGMTVKLDDSVWVQPMGTAYFRAEFFLP